MYQKELGWRAVVNSYQGATKIHRYLMKRWDEVIGDDIIGIIKVDD